MFLFYSKWDCRGYRSHDTYKKINDSIYTDFPHFFKSEPQNFFFSRILTDSTDIFYPSLSVKFCGICDHLWFRQKKPQSEDQGFFFVPRERRYNINTLLICFLLFFNYTSDTKLLRDRSDTSEHTINHWLQKAFDFFF